MAPGHSPEFPASFPETGKNPFGRPVFQNLQYSDTPTQPLVPMRFANKTAEPGKAHTYRVIAVNSRFSRALRSIDSWCRDNRHISISEQQRVEFVHPAELVRPRSDLQVLRDRVIPGNMR